jgi:hypothetical protein
VQTRPSYEMVETALRQRMETLFVDGLAGDDIDSKAIQELSEIVVGVFLQAHFAFHTLEPIRKVTETAFRRCLVWYAKERERVEDGDDE